MNPSGDSFVASRSVFTRLAVSNVNDAASGVAGPRGKCFAIADAFGSSDDGSDQVSGDCDVYRPLTVHARNVASSRVRDDSDAFVREICYSESHGLHDTRD